MISKVQEVRKVIKEAEINGITKFTVQTVCERLGVDWKDPILYKMWGSVISGLSSRKELFKMKQRRKHPDFKKSLTVYTSKLKDIAEENPSYQQPLPKQKELSLNYAEIGKAIIARMKTLNKNIMDRDEELRELNDEWQEQKEQIENLNRTIIKLNAHISEMKKGGHNTQIDNGKFKLSEIATITGNGKGLYV